jgi:hypothetical protein
MMVRSKICSTKRPDTLMQLSRSSLLEIRLATRVAQSGEGQRSGVSTAGESGLPHPAASVGQSIELCLVQSRLVRDRTQFDQLNGASSSLLGAAAACNARAAVGHAGSRSSLCRFGRDECLYRGSIQKSEVPATLLARADEVIE